jgi:uncharacterized protein (TIGR03435 family)
MLPASGHPAPLQIQHLRCRRNAFTVNALVGLMLATAPVFSQTPSQPASANTAKSLAFQAADIHPSPFSYGGNYFHVAPIAGARFVVHQATPLDLITMAFHVEPDAVTGGPPGLEFDHYDIVAKVPPRITQADVPRMLVSLLADRFKLHIETEMKPLPAYLLRSGKVAAKMKPTADPNSDSDCRYQPPDPPPPPSAPFPSTITLKCSNMTMEQFAQQLHEFGGEYLNHPVEDMTGLKGAWDFDFRFSWQPVADGITLFEAVDRLGLKLEAGTAPREVIAITNMADAPTANIAGIEKLLPPPPNPSFEVAVIRPSKNESKEADAELKSIDQVTFSGSERRLISLAWAISEKTIFNAPAYTDDKVWDISAKIPVQDTPQAPGTRPQVDFDQVRLMLRSLLAERFGLKAHTEDRPGNAYTLLPGTPKLKKADPANRSSCTDRSTPGEKDPRAANPLVTQYMHCDNVTMDQFARELQAYSGYIIKTPVLNMTGIQGRYDLTLSFTGLHTLEQLGLAQGGATPMAGATGTGTGGSGAADPAGVVLLQDAVTKQLGLKLVFEKRPIPAFVVDSMQEKPTDN